MADEPLKNHTQETIDKADALIAKFQAAIDRDPANAPPSLSANIRALQKHRRRLVEELEDPANAH